MNGPNVVYLVWDLFWAIVTFMVGYMSCLEIHKNCAPSTYNHRSQVQQRDVQLVPIRMVALFHAILTSISGFAYIFGMISLNQLTQARLISCAYLLYDFIQTWKTYDRQQHVQRHSQRSGKNWLGAVANSSPIGVGFHHVITVMFMYGWFFDGDVSGVVTYFIGELPVLFVNLFWIFSYLGQTSTVYSMMVHNLAVITYAIIRIGIFALVFLKVILININFLNPFAMVYVLLLMMVYFLNIIWFTMLLERNKQFSPVDCSNVPGC